MVTDWVSKHFASGVVSKSAFNKIEEQLNRIVS